MTEENLNEIKKFYDRQIGILEKESATIPHIKLTEKDEQGNDEKFIIFHCRAGGLLYFSKCYEPYNHIFISRSEEKDPQKALEDMSNRPHREDPDYEFSEALKKKIEKQVDKMFPTLKTGGYETVGSKEDDTYGVIAQKKYEIYKNKRGFEYIDHEGEECNVYKTDIGKCFFNETLKKKCGINRMYIKLFESVAQDNSRSKTSSSTKKSQKDASSTGWHSFALEENEEVEKEEATKRVFKLTDLEDSKTELYIPVEGKRSFLNVFKFKKSEKFHIFNEKNEKLEFIVDEGKVLTTKSYRTLQQVFICANRLGADYAKDFNKIANFIGLLYAKRPTKKTIDGIRVDIEELDSELKEIITYTKEGKVKDKKIGVADLAQIFTMLPQNEAWSFKTINAKYLRCTDKDNNSLIYKRTNIRAEIFELVLLLEGKCYNIMREIINGNKKNYEDCDVDISKIIDADTRSKRYNQKKNVKKILYALQETGFIKDFGKVKRKSVIVSFVETEELKKRAEELRKLLNSHKKKK